MQRLKVASILLGIKLLLQKCDATSLFWTLTSWTICRYWEFKIVGFYCITIIVIIIWDLLSEAMNAMNECSISHSLTQPHTHSLTNSPFHWLPHSLIDLDPLTHSFTHELTCPLTHSFTHLPTGTFIHSLTHLHTDTAIHSRTHLPTDSLIHSLTHLPTDSLNHSLTHLPPHWLTQSLTNSHAHDSLIHSLTPLPTTHSITD